LQIYLDFDTDFAPIAYIFMISVQHGLYRISYQGLRQTEDFMLVSMTLC